MILMLSIIRLATNGLYLTDVPHSFLNYRYLTTNFISLVKMTLTRHSERSEGILRKEDLQLLISV